MSDIPPGWTQTTLGEIADTSLGKMLDRGKTQGDNLVPYLRNSNVQWGHIDLDDVLTMDIPPEEREFFGLRPGDLLVCEGGEIGRCAIWPGGSGYMAFQKALHRVRPYGSIPAKFVLYLLEYLSNTGALLHFATGSIIKHLPQEQLRRLPVRLPPIGEQQRIVATLEDHLSRLEHAESILSGIAVRLSYLYQSILKEKFRNISLGSMSHIRKLGDVAIVASGQTPHGISESLSVEPSADHVPFYKVGDMNHSDGRFMSSSRTYIHRDDATRLGLKIRPAGTVLIPKRGGAIATNKKRILRTPSAYDLNTMGIIPSREIDSTYLWRWFEQINLAELSDGSNVPQINHPDLMDLEISVPDLTVQQGLAEELDILTTGIARLLRAVNESRKSPLRSMLLKEAFAGQLVPQDPADEPIEVLLKRVHAERVTQSRPRRRRKVANPTLQEETQL